MLQVSAELILLLALKALGLLSLYKIVFKYPKNCTPQEELTAVSDTTSMYLITLPVCKVPRNIHICGTANENNSFIEMRN
jgi:hypothetical protein